MNMATYLYNKEKRENTLFRITPHGSFYVVDGKEITLNEFAAMYPMPLTVNPDSWKQKFRNDIDGRRNWMQEY